MIKINNHPKSMKDFSTDIASGFTMKFLNGNTISVQFGMANYCSNRNDESRPESTTAEIAIWNTAGNWYVFEDSIDNVRGYCSADEVAKWIHFAANTQI